MECAWGRVAIISAMKVRCAPHRPRLKIRAAPLATLKGILVAEQFPPHLTSPGQPFAIRVTLQLEGQPDFRKILPVHVTGVAVGGREEIPLHFKCGSGPNKHEIGRRTALELTLQYEYEESTSLHQNRAFALKIEIDAARARKYNLAVAPLLLGPTVVRESTVEEEGLAFSHTVTGESAADARQRIAEERGEVCDLTGEGEGAARPAKKVKVVHWVS